MLPVIPAFKQSFTPDVWEIVWETSILWLQLVKWSFPWSPHCILICSLLLESHSTRYGGECMEGHGYMWCKIISWKYARVACLEVKSRHHSVNLPGEKVILSQQCQQNFICFLRILSPVPSTTAQSKWTWPSKRFLKLSSRQWLTWVLFSSDSLNTWNPGWKSPSCNFIPDRNHNFGEMSVRGMPCVLPISCRSGAFVICLHHWFARNFATKGSILPTPPPHLSLGLISKAFGDCFEMHCPST